MTYFSVILLYVVHYVSAYQCPEYGVRFVGGEGLLETVPSLPPGWSYWESCARLCQERRECQYWTMVQDTTYSDSNRQHCILKTVDAGYNKPDPHPPMVFISGDRNCSSHLSVPPASSRYVPGTPGGPWTEEEIGITRQRILEMIKPVPDTIKINYDDWSHDLHVRKLSENTLIRLGFHDCLRYEDGSGGCDGCISWKNMGQRNEVCVTLKNGTEDCYRNLEMPVRTDNNDMSRTVFWLEKIYTTKDWPFSYNGPRPQDSLQDTGKSRADLWAFAAWVALERSVERANHACDHDYLGRQQVTLLEGRHKCDIKLDKVHKFRYGRVDCLPMDPELPYKADKHEYHPLTFGTGTETVDFMKEQFNMDAADFIALIAVHSSAHHVMLQTSYFWFAPAYLSNMYHKYLANRPMYRAHGNVKGIAEDGANHWIFGRENATSQMFSAVGDGEGEPTADMRWRVFCDNYYNTSEGGPCLWRPAAFMSEGYPSCFDGFDQEGNKRVLNSTYCKDTRIDEDGIERGAAFPPVYRPGDLDEIWVGQFGLSHEYGLYKKFERNEINYRPYGCPGLPEKYEDMPYHGKHTYVWTEQEQCPLNDYAPEGVPLFQLVEDMADDHDLWAAHLLAGYEKMIENGYQHHQLKDAPENSWFGYYTMFGQEKFDEALTDFENFVTANAPLVITNPDVDPYVCGTHGSQFFKCRFTFSEALELAKTQYAWPLQFKAP